MMGVSSPLLQCGCGRRTRPDQNPLCEMKRNQFFCLSFPYAWLSRACLGKAQNTIVFRLFNEIEKSRASYL